MIGYVIFSSGYASLQLPLIAHEPVEEYIHSQVSSLTSGGKRVVASGGYIRKVFKVSFKNITLTQKNALASFFEDVSEGMLNTFSYTDSNEEVHTVRFAENNLKFIKVANNIFDVELSMELSDE